MPYDRTVIEWLEDPVAEMEGMASVEMSRQTIRRFHSMVSEQMAADVAVAASLNPTASPELVVGSTVAAGVPAEDDLIAEASALEQEQTGQVGGVSGFFADVGDALRGVTRWTALAMNGLYDEVINRPLRTMANMQSYGMDLGEAYSSSGNEPLGAFGEAVGGLMRGEQVNLGSGFLPGSNLALPVQESLAQLDEDAKVFETGDSAAIAEVVGRYSDQYGYVNPDFVSPTQQQMVFQTQLREKIMEQASDRTTPLGQSQAKFGVPVTQRAQAEGDAVLWNPGTNAKPQYSQVSIGRVFAGLVVEPGTQPFHYASGAGDFLANIFMDPSAGLGKAAAIASKAHRTLGTGRLASEVVEGVGDATRQIDDLAQEINHLKSTPEYARYQGWQSAKSRQTADQLAAQGLIDEVAHPRLARTQAVGRTAEQIRRLEGEMSELAANPDLVRFTGWADSTRGRIDDLGELTTEAWLDLKKTRPALADQYEVARRAHRIQTQIDDLGGRITELAGSDDYAKFQKWSPATQEKALRLARDADIDPKVSPRNAEMQRVGREAARVATEIDARSLQVGELTNMATFSHQIRKASGVIDGIRKDVDPKKISEFISGPTARRFVETLKDADLQGVDEALRHVKGVIPRSLRTELADAKTNADVIAALMPHLGTTITDTGLGVTRVLTSPIARLHHAVNGRVQRKVAAAGHSYQAKPLFSGSRLSRWFSEMSPNSMDLRQMDQAYQLLERHAINLGWNRGDELLEGHLRNFANLDDGDWSSAFDVLANYNKDLLERLAGQGLDSRVAEAVTRFTTNQKDDALWFVNRLGHEMEGPARKTRMTIDGTEIPAPGPQLISELFKGTVHMPDARLVRHAAAELDLLGRIANRVATKGAKAGFDQRWMVRAANNAMTKAWKPMVLLRVAWPVRVVGEEQARMAAAGVSRPFTHPIHHIAMAISDHKMTDVLGDSFTHADEFARARAGRIQFQGEWRTRGSEKWVTWDRSKNYNAWLDGTMRELNQLWSDPVVRRLFSVDPSTVRATVAKAPTPGRTASGYELVDIAKVNKAANVTLETAGAEKLARAQELADTMKAKGFDGFWNDPAFADQGAISITGRVGNREVVQIADGQTRLLAAQLAGFDQVPVRFVNKYSRGEFTPSTREDAIREFLGIDKPKAVTSAQPSRAGELSDVDRVRDTARWLYEGEGRPLLDQLSRHADEDTRKALNSLDTVEQYVESVYARAHMKAGGDFRLLRPDGTWVDSRGVKGMIEDGNVPTRATYQITKPGLDELTQSYGTSRFADADVAERMANTADALAKNPQLTDARPVREALSNLAQTKRGQQLPSIVKGVADPDAELVSRWDRAISTMFDVLMSKPTNRLSRSPAFRTYYWKSIGEMTPFMDEATQAAAREQARKAGTELEFLQGAGISKPIIGRSTLPKGDGLITDLAAADNAAKAKALTNVQDLLFDVSKRKNASDAMSIIMPFADAWGEVLGTWARIMSQQNIVPFRRFQQVIESGRESDMFNTQSGWSNEGFFRNDGEREVFSLPGVSDLYRSLSGVDADWEYPLSGLSIATSVAPAVGPLVQFVAQPIIPDEPGWQWLREYISPVGQTSIQRGAIPSSWSRVVGAFDWSRNVFGDEALIATYNGTVADVLAAMSRDDPDFSEKIRRDREGVLEEARNAASRLWMVQALARYVGPAAPSTRPTLEDKDGFVWQTTVLHDEYFKLIEEHRGDRIAAHSEFVSKFGVDPITVSTPKSTQIEPRGTTTISSNFQKENPDLFDEYSGIAYYLGPAHLDDHAPFDWDAYYANIVEGTTERLDPDTWLRLMNDSKGRLAYDKRRRDIEEIHGRGLSDAGWDTDLRTQISIELREFDEALMSEYPGYTGAQFGTEVAGMPAKISTEEQITQFTDLLNERPDMAELDENGDPVNPAVHAVANYMKARAYANQMAQSQGLTSTMESGEGDPEHPSYQRRAVLRTYAAELIQTYPEFGPIWEGVFSREMVNDDGEEMTIEDAYEVLIGPG